MKKEVTKDDNFTTLILYVHYNPITHGFVKKINEWPWTSYKSIMNNESQLINSLEVINCFGNKSSFEIAHKQLEESNTTFQMFKIFRKW